MPIAQTRMRALLDIIEELLSSRDKVFEALESFHKGDSATLGYLKVLEAQTQPSYQSTLTIATERTWWNLRAGRNDINRRYMARRRAEAQPAESKLTLTPRQQAKALAQAEAHLQSLLDDLPPKEGHSRQQRLATEIEARKRQASEPPQEIPDAELPPDLPGELDPADLFPPTTT